jgi:hypothetical protein
METNTAHNNAFTQTGEPEAPFQSNRAHLRCFHNYKASLMNDTFYL